jgi:hypothetical protein
MAYDKSNRPERIWHDPPMADDPPVDVTAFTLGSGVTPEVRRVFAILQTNSRKARLISNIITASVFTISYAIAITIPAILQIDITPVDILSLFIAVTIAISTFEFVFSKK